MGNAYIEKIVVTNFKSYGTEKLEIPIGEGFIGIVGPNGAGKSNIGDAITFGLGLSTSKTMRAKNLTHLIYSKQGQREDFAQVDIHFSNPQIFGYDEFVVTRIIYKDGKSLYKLNGKIIREKDLHLILARGGIYKEGYNIVLQGDIVKFVKMTPLERRKIIEDVAGISEYEQKRQLALEELGEADIKIRELKPLVEELEANLEKFEKEKERLRQYKALMEKKHILECVLLLKEKQNLLKDLQKTSEEKEALETKSSKLLETIDIKTKELKDVEQKITNLQETLLPYRESSGKLSAKIEYIKEQKVLKEKELKKELSHKEDIEKKIDFLQKDLLNLEKELLEVEQEKLSKEKEIYNIEHIIKEKEKELKSTEEKLNLSPEEIDQIEKKEKELKSILEQKKKQYQQYIDQIQDISQKQNRYKDDIQRLKADLQALEQKDSVEEKLKIFQKNIEEARLSIEAIQQTIAKYTSSLTETKKEIEQIISEKARIESQLRYNDDDTYIFQNIKGVYGKVEDLISLKDEEYKTAIEAAAGARLSYVVVESEEVAKTCIELLKKNSDKRVSFIPLNRIKTQSLPPYPRQRGYIDFALKLVDYDKALEPAISFVFGDTLVVESFDVAKSLQNYRCVTLEGEVFEKTGVITGGKAKQNSNIGKKALLEKLESLNEKYNLLKEKEQQLDQNISKAKSTLIEKEGIIAINTKYIKDLENQKKDMLLQKSNILERIKSGEEYIEHLENKKKELLEMLEPLKEEIKYIEEKLTNLELRKKDILSYYTSKEIKELKDSIEYYKKLHLDKTKELNTVELKKNDISKNTEYVKSSIDQKKQELIGAHSQIKSLEQELMSLELELKSAEEELKESNAMFYKLYEEKELLEKEQKNLQAELGGLKLEHERLLEKIGSLSNDITRIQTKIESINEALKEKEYDGTIYEEQNQSASKLKEELERTKKLLESMSDINLKAEEEYEETLNRLKDYKEKLDQLIKDKQAIKAMIEEIDRKKYSAFMEAFNNIRKNFKEIYAKVSYQGKADLSLDNEEDPFSGGVSIFVKPRGKDVQYVEAISGGEQTLAAISLIFAIQEYKPSVFYYFDEIDAHLDEANAYLLGQMIKEKSKNVQFIVVTLRENLANFADKLIGVTNKDGISKTLTFKSLKEVS